MADPILANTLRVQLVLQAVTDLPEDRFVMNHAWIINPTATAPVTTLADGLQTVYEDFFNDIHPPGIGSLNVLVAGWVASAEIRVYDLSQAPPRVPEIRPLTVAFTATSGLPGEVAMVSSIVAQRNQPRSRGRFYFGPLAGSVTSGGTALTDSRPNANAMNALVGATNFLAPQDPITGFPQGHVVGPSPDDIVILAVISQMNGTASSITGGWVDDAFDTQRRRGQAPSSRTTWGSFTS